MTDPAESSQSPFATETIRLLGSRVSVRDFTDRPVSDEMVEAILAAAFRAPTSSNTQTCSVVTVRDPAARERLSVITRQRRHILEAPVFLTFCADLTRADAAMKARGHDLSPVLLESCLVAIIDAALVGMSAYLAADSLGLKGVMIGAVRNDALATAEVLGLPNRVFAVFGMCLGWPAEAPRQKPRLPPQATVFHETWGRAADGTEAGSTEAVAAALGEYDTRLAAHYAAVGKATTPDSWTADLVKKFTSGQRANLRAELKALGYDFE